MLAQLESVLEEKIKSIATVEDPAHDLLHFKRVVHSAKLICKNENAKPEVVIPAAWLHDFVIVPKNDPNRKIASKLSAEAAIEYLKELHYPNKYFAEIEHAIVAHSFSAKVQANTLEAKVVQDADRLDSLGAIGIARCFATAGLLKKEFYEMSDPFCQSRQCNDQLFTLDHFYAKLFKIAETLHTDTAKTEGLRRLKIMKAYLKDLSLEL